MLYYRLFTSYTWYTNNSCLQRNEQLFYLFLSKIWLNKSAVFARYSTYNKTQKKDLESRIKIFQILFCLLFVIAEHHPHLLSCTPPRPWNTTTLTSVWWSSTLRETRSYCTCLPRITRGLSRSWKMPSSVQISQFTLGL